MNNYKVGIWVSSEFEIFMLISEASKKYNF